MNKPVMSVAAAVVFGLAACAPARHKAPGPEADLPTVQARLSEAEGKITQLSQRLTLLQIIVDSHQRTLQDLGGETAAGDLASDASPAAAFTETGAAPAGAETALQLSDTAPSEPPLDAPDPESGTTPSEPVMAETAAAPVSEAISETSAIVPETAQQPDAAAAPVPETVAFEPSIDSLEEESAQPLETEGILPTPEPNPRYQEAMEVFRGGDYETAAGLFEKFARQFPDNDLADNALYWSGECRYTRKDFTGAIEQFRQVIEDYPSGSKVPDALLKIGFAHLSLGDRKTAVTYLKRVVSQFPFSAAGSKAEERLKTLQK